MLAGVLHLDLRDPSIGNRIFSSDALMAASGFLSMVRSASPPPSSLEVESRESTSGSDAVAEAYQASSGRSDGRRSAEF